LGLDEVLRFIARQGLGPLLAERERVSILGAFTEQRGALGRAAWALRLRPADLSLLVQTLGLERTVEELRERFRQEVLSPRSLASLLDQLGRTRYLEDLGIQAQLADLARSRLRLLLEGTDTERPSLKKLAEMERIPLSQLLRALDTLGLPGESERPAH
jgi:hypothetical protein